MRGLDTGLDTYERFRHRYVRIVEGYERVRHRCIHEDSGGVMYEDSGGLDIVCCR